MTTTCSGLVFENYHMRYAIAGVLRTPEIFSQTLTYAWFGPCTTKPDFVCLLGDGKLSRRLDPTIGRGGNPGQGGIGDGRAIGPGGRRRHADIEGAKPAHHAAGHDLHNIKNNNN